MLVGTSLKAESGVRAAVRRRASCAAPSNAGRASPSAPAAFGRRAFASFAPAPTVFITHRTHADVVALLERSGLRVLVGDGGGGGGTLPRAAVLARAARAEGLMTFMPDLVDAAFVRACPRLRVVAGAKRGLDNEDAAALAARGAWLTRSADLLTAPTAELAVALATALARRVPEGDAFVRSGGFEGWRPELFGKGLAGATVGVVGLGAVGRAVCARVAAFAPRELLWIDAEEEGEEAAAAAAAAAAGGDAAAAAGAARRLAAPSSGPGPSKPVSAAEFAAGWNSWRDVADARLRAAEAGAPRAGGANERAAIVLAAARPPRAPLTRSASLGALLSASDFVFPLTPLTRASRHLLGARELALMRRDAVLVNVGRGGCVDEAAVAARLEAGLLGGYAADVFELEDWALPDRRRDVPPALLRGAAAARTLLTPHLGSAVVAVRREIELEAAENLVDVLVRGVRPRGAANDPAPEAVAAAAKRAAQEAAAEAGAGAGTDVAT